MNSKDPFDFYLDHYKEQLVAGYTKETLNFGLRVYMRDYNKLPKQAPKKVLGQQRRIGNSFTAWTRLSKGWSIPQVNFIRSHSWYSLSRAARRRASAGWTGSCLPRHS